MVWCSSGFILLICLRQPSLTHSDRPFNSAWSRKLLVRRASTSKDCIFQRGLSTWQTMQTSKSAVTHRCNRPVLFPRRPEVQAHMVPFAAPGQISGVGILLPGCAFTAFGLWAPTVCFSLYDENSSGRMWRRLDYTKGLLSSASSRPFSSLSSYLLLLRLCVVASP